MTAAATAPAARVRLPVLPGDAAVIDRAEPAPHQLIDGFARRVTYLRVSLTDRCNYRCTYCMPDDGSYEVTPHEDVASASELASIISAFAATGVTRVRLTGGEPTLRRDLVDIVARVVAIPGITDVALSTNGERLLELAGPLRRAGLHRLNISIDTLDPVRFRAITRRGNLGRVLAGTELASSLGFRAIKLNAVALRGFNHDELPALTSWAWERGITPRFIEQMPMAGGRLFVPGEFLPAAEVRAILAASLGAPGEQLQILRADDDLGSHRGGGPARYYMLPSRNDDARVGIISPVTESFCDDCNRVRIDSAGRMHACLAFDDAVDLRSAVQAGTSPEDLGRAIAHALGDKRRGHEFTTLGCGAPKKAMIATGG